uniref:Heme oxygenase n=1 Tax=Lonomia obliqua TaxID=304329 RepID=Q5MGP1_LONON|nr:heme oxygenase [Lonomia obliqua]
MVYVYHLYLGLLSGGQILAKKRKVFGQDKNPETNMYIDRVTDFAGVDIGQLKRDFRQAMNVIADKMTELERKAFIDESSQVFVMNNLIVNSIGGQSKVLYDLLCKASVVPLVPAAVVLPYQ